MGPNIFIFDIETAPLVAYIWSRWKENVPMARLLTEWRMLTWAGKYLDEEEVYYDSCHHYENHEDDRPILESLHEHLDNADIVIAHNLRKFDRKKVNARFLAHGMSPPSPYRLIDTLEEAKKNFALTSNRLDDIAKLLNIGQKADTGGFDLWSGCMAGDKKSYETMVDYNIQDVVLLEDVYTALRPWMNNHPNVAVYNDGDNPQCPKCGSNHLQYRGYATTQTGRFRRFQCQDCSGWGRERFTDLDKNKRASLVTNSQ